MMRLSEEVKETEGVVFAGGAGVRMGSSVPKSLLEVGGETLMQRCLEMFVRSGFSKFSLILGHRANEVRGHVHSLHLLADYHVERFDAGKGKALQNAMRSGVVDRRKRSILVFPDDIYLMPDLPSFVLSHHLFAVFKHGALASVALAPGWEWPYGSVTLGVDWTVVDFVEKPFV